MSPDAPAPQPRPSGAMFGRLRAAWRALSRERRLAAMAALGLLVSMLLPWYQKSFFTVVDKRAIPGSSNLTAFGAFSFIEAAVLLVAAGVLTLLFLRTERHAFHLPGGDGTVITAAGAWAALLIFIRLFDKPDAPRSGATSASTIGLQWGIFIALAAAGALVLAGTRIRATQRPGSPAAARPGGRPRDPSPSSGTLPVPRRDPRRARRPAPEPGTEATRPLPPQDAPTVVQPTADDAPPDRLF